MRETLRFIGWIRDVRKGDNEFRVAVAQKRRDPALRSEVGLIRSPVPGEIAKPKGISIFIGPTLPPRLPNDTSSHHLIVPSDISTDHSQSQLVAEAARVVGDVSRVFVQEQVAAQVIQPSPQVVVHLKR